MLITLKCQYEVYDFMLSHPGARHTACVKTCKYFKGRRFHNFASFLIIYMELLIRADGASRLAVSTELFYFRRDDFAAWCFKYYYRPRGSSYISFSWGINLNLAPGGKLVNVPPFHLTQRSTTAAFMSNTDLWSIHLRA